MDVGQLQSSLRNRAALSVLLELVRPDGTIAASECTQAHTFEGIIALREVCFFYSLIHFASFSLSHIFFGLGAFCVSHWQTFTLNLTPGVCLDVHVVEAIKHVPLASLRFLYAQISRPKVTTSVFYFVTLRLFNGLLTCSHIHSHAFPPLSLSLTLAP